MKNLSIALLAIVMMCVLSCSKDLSVAPASQNSVGLVIPQISNGKTIGNLLLLKDGRTANPVSGIPNFNSINTGEKLSLSFTAGQVKNGILDIDVTTVESAEDSSFVPAPTQTDTISTADFFIGTFSGSTSHIVSDTSANSQDTLLIAANPISITFNRPYTYSVISPSGNYPAPGTGTYTFVHGTYSWLGTITFTDDYTDSNVVLNGTFNYFISNANLLCLYGLKDGVQYSIYVQKN